MLGPVGLVEFLLRPWRRPPFAVAPVPQQQPLQEVSVTSPQNTALAEYVQSTAWYRRYAKAIAAFVAALVNVAWLLSVLPSSVVPTGVAVGVALAVQFVGGVVGVAAVPNSPTVKQLQQVEEYVGRHRRPE